MDGIQRKESEKDGHIVISREQKHGLEKSNVTKKQSGSDEKLNVRRGRRKKRCSHEEINAESNELREMEVDQNDEVTSMDCIDTTSPETKQCFCPIKANSVSEHTALTANDQLLKGTTTEHVDITGKEMGQYDESTYSTLTTANDELLQASEGSDKAIDGQPLDDVNFSTGILQCTEATTKMDATEIDVDPNEQAISPATTDNDGSVGTLRELELNKGNSIAEDGIVSLNDKEHGELVLTGNVDVTILEIEEQEHFKEVVDIFQHTEETTKMDTTEMNMDHNEEAISPAVRTAANDESVEMQRDLDLNKDNRTVEGRNVTLNIKQHTEPALTCNTDMTRLELKEQEHFNEVTDVLVNASKDDTLKSLEEGNPGSVQDGEIITADIQANEKLSRAGKKPKGRGRPKVLDQRAKDQVSQYREELLKLLPEPGSAEFSKEAHEKLREIFAHGSHVECPKEGCTKTYRNLISYKYHVSRCGCEMSFLCKKCGKTYKSENGLKYHFNSAHQNQGKRQNKDGVSVEDEEPKNTTMAESEDVGEVSFSRYGRRRRGPVKRPDNEMEDDETPSLNQTRETTSKEEANNQDHSSDKAAGRSSGVNSEMTTKWMEYVEKVELSETAEPKAETSGEAWERLMEQTIEKLNKKEEVLCPKNCGYSIKVKKKLEGHLKICPGIDRRKYRCLLCKVKRFVTLQGIKAHIIGKHRKKQSDDEDTSEYEEVEAVVKAVKPKKILQKNYEENTKAWYQAFHSKLVFPSWKPTLNHWSKLPQSEVEDYLPVRKMSPRFKIHSVTEYETIQEVPEFQLPIFSSVPINTTGILCNLTFNVGGSVWAMDWAPFPVDEKNCDQYLAIGCHRDPEQVHLLNESYQDKGVLQIWRVPTLQNGQRPVQPSEFCLGIAYDYGPLWDIRWCPSGAWEKVTNKPETLPRLGLLALACGDGKLRVLSVPFPNSLLKQESHGEKGNPQNLIFRAVPHAELTPGSVCREYRGECGAVRSVAWLPAKGHKKIVASYSDGTIAVWDLSTQNFLLRVASNGLTERFYPVSHFQAHQSVIRTLAWCPSDSNYIATGSYDRAIKIWDLRQTSQPLTCLKRGFSYGFSWPIHWASVMFSCDSALNRGAWSGARTIDYFIHSVANEHMEHNTNSLNFHNAATWDLDYSDWSNMLVSVDAAGEVLLNILGRIHSKQSHRNRMPIFRATVEEMENSDDVENEKNNLGSTGQNHTSTVENSENDLSLNDSLGDDAYKLIFKDIHPLYASKDERARLNRDTQIAPADKPTYAALHKVRWNPNLTSYYWMATGGRAGIVRICHVSTLD